MHVTKHHAMHDTLTTGAKSGMMMMLEDAGQVDYRDIAA